MLHANLNGHQTNLFVRLYNPFILLFVLSGLHYDADVAWVLYNWKRRHEIKHQMIGEFLLPRPVQYIENSSEWVYLVSDNPM
jgi:hypothetical protein